MTLLVVGRRREGAGQGGSAMREKRGSIGRYCWWFSTKQGFIL